MNASQQIEILLVEDNPRDADLTLRVLRKHHLANQVAHVKDGQEALDWLLRPDAPHRPQRLRVVFLDLKLPKVDGLDVLRAIRADSRTRSLPVVVLTSSREERDLIETYHLGVNSYVVKPVDFEQFTAAVAQTGNYWLIVNEMPPI